MGGLETYTNAVIEAAVVEGAEKGDEIDDEAEQSADGGDDAEHGADVEQGVALRGGRLSLRRGAGGLGRQQGRLQVALGLGSGRGLRCPARLRPFARVDGARHFLLLLHPARNSSLGRRARNQRQRQAIDRKGKLVPKLDLPRDGSLEFWSFWGVSTWPC